MNLNKKLALIIFCAIFYVSTTISALPTGLVVRSSLYGPEAASSAAEVLPFQSFSLQLGLQPPKEITNTNAAIIANQRVLSAISDAAYPVTPGDVYRLIYFDGAKQVSMDLQVDSSYTIDVPRLGFVDASSLSFSQLKQKLFSMVSSYSYSNPQVVLLSTGSFTVSVIGEVEASRMYEAWGLSRLSSVLDCASSYASTRDVAVTSSSGKTEHYDLFKALKQGDLLQDPLLRSGDVVTLRRADKLVTLSGNVYRPGTYQLGKGEGLKELVSSYGGGVLPGSNIQNIRIQRYDSLKGAWEAEYADLLTGSTSLSSLDQVIVDTVVANNQSITIEGAIKSDEAYDATSSTALVGQSSGRIFYQFYPGETLQQMLRFISPRLMTVSDLEHVYLTREGKRYPFDTTKMLLGSSQDEPFVLQANDVLTIPFTQRFVTVTGAVVRSGVYAYVPDKTADYYLFLAGGATSDASKPLTLTITDSEGHGLERNSLIPQETTITIKENTFIKNLAPTVAIISLISAVVSIIHYSVLTSTYLK
ncbi:MAG: SLBB domain-containing protein [Sphaerochaetaceae bacterium]